MTRPAGAQFSAVFGCYLGLLGNACGRPAGIAAISEASTRWVETPSSLVVLSQARPVAGLPGSITFGDARGRSALYLQFSPEWRENGPPLRGFIALEPRAGETPDAEAVEGEVWRVRSPWQASALHTWSDKPELAPPYVTASTSSSPAHTLRIDITELLRFAANNPELDRGWALIARGGSGHGASFATGMSAGAAPRLEVYTRCRRAASRALRARIRARGA